MKNFINIFFLFFTSFLFAQNPTLTINNGGNVIIKDNSYIILNDDFTTKAGGALKLINNGSLLINSGNFYMFGKFNSGQGSIIMYQNVNHDHYIQCSSDNTFYNLIITGANFNPYDIHLLNNINVSNKLYIDLRKFNLNGFGVDLLTTGYLDAETDSHRAYDNNFGTGYIKRTVTIPPNTTINPGNIGLTLITHGNQMGTTVIKRLHFRDSIQGVPSIYRIFDVTPQFNGGNYVGGLDVDLTFKYFSGELGTDILSEEPNLQLWRSGDYGNTWEYKGGTIDIINKTVTYTGFNQFSLVTLAPSSPSPLPVTLSEFKGECNSLTWTTLVEINSSYFEILYSQDAVNWESIGKVQSYGNSTSQKIYKFENVIKSGYYRLKEVDKDENFELFDIVYVQCEEFGKFINLYPNPNNGTFTINHNSNYSVYVYDVKGSLVYQADNNNNSFDLQFLISGTYFIKLTNNYNILHFKFIKQ